jgi:ribose 5-phosphate isomerase B
MKIAIASDHAGFPLKEEVRDYVRKLGHEIQDLGAYNTDPSDYADFAVLVGKALISAHQGVEHDEMNVLVMGERIIGTALAFECVESYLNAKFIATEERFVRRLNKVKAIEKQYMPEAAATTLTT